METKNIIYIANILLTRRCNLKCSYCGLVKDSDDKPQSYPNMKYYFDNELISKQWIEIIKRIRKNNSKCFFIFYGGEPLLYEGLSDIINYCNIENVFYTIISNNTDVAYNKFKELLTQVEFVKGYTASVDPVIYDKEADDDIKKKSKLGLERLIEIKEKYPTCDVVAEITATNKNIKFLNRTIQELTKHKIYASVTCIDLKKNKYYDFSNVEKTDLLIEQKPNIKKIFSTIVKNSKNDKLLVHCPDLIMDMYNALPCNLHCKMNSSIHNITVDSDGKLRTCLRIRGVNVPFLSIGESILDNGELSSKLKFAMKNDIISYCKLCNWTCVLMSGNHNKYILH